MRSYEVKDAHRGKLVIAFRVEALCTVGPYVVSSGWPHSTLHIWDPTTWARVHTLPIPNFHEVNCVYCLACDGSMLFGCQLGCGQDGTACASDPPSLLMWRVGGNDCLTGCVYLCV